MSNQDFQKCPRCGSEDYQILKQSGCRTDFFCECCGKIFSAVLVEGKEKENDGRK